MSGWWNILSCTCFLSSADSVLLVCLIDALFVSSKKRGLQRAAHFVFFFPAFFLDVSLDSFSFPLQRGLCWRCFKSSASSSWRLTQRERLAPHAESDLPLLLTLQHTEGPALCKIGGRAAAAQLALAEASVNHPWTVLALFCFFLLNLFWILVELNPHPCFPFSLFCFLWQN